MTRSRSAKSGRSTTRKTRQAAKPVARRAADVCAELGIQPYVLKFWEAEIPELGDRVGEDRLYGPKEVTLAKKIREMVEDQRLGLAEVRQRLGGSKKRASGGSDRAPARTARTASRPARSDEPGGSAELRSARARVSQLEGELRELRTIRADHERLQREVNALRRELVELDGIGAPAESARRGGAPNTAPALPDDAREELDACLAEARRLGGEIEALMVSLAPPEARTARRAKRAAGRSPKGKGGDAPGLFP